MNQENGNVCWFDIPVTNVEQSKAFYGELFNWQFVPEGDEYTMIKVGEDVIGGLRPASRARVESDAPVVYIMVEKLSESIERAKKLGAKLVGDSVSTGENCGAFQLFEDADKNLMAFYSKS